MYMRKQLIELVKKRVFNRGCFFNGSLLEFCDSGGKGTEGNITAFTE